MRAQYDVLEMTWEAFKEAVEETFVTNAMKSQLTREFQDLIQGTTMMTEYVKKFNELSKYAPYLINIETKKNDKFIEALGHYLSKSVLVSKNEPFSRVVDLALKFERKEKNYQVEKLTRASGSEVNR